MWAKLTPAGRFWTCYIVAAACAAILILEVVWAPQS